MVLSQHSKRGYMLQGNTYSDIKGLCLNVSTVRNVLFGRIQMDPVLAALMYLGW